MKYAVHVGDAVEWANNYSGPLFHALICDPPYHLTSITDRFGNEDAAPAKPGRDGAFARLSKGFMGQTWDGGDVSFRPETWRSFWKCLYPGGFGIAFAGSRTYHRIATAIEDAGFEIHPLTCWAFSSGFPKATRIPSAAFDGHRYGKQALKPASEPCITFQKPVTVNPFCVIIVELFTLLELVGCTYLNAQDAATLINPLHLHLKVVVDNFAHQNAENLALLKDVRLAGKSSESNLANVTLHDFAVEPVPTKEEMRRLAQTITTGKAGHLFPKDTDTSGVAMDILQNIVWLWNRFLDALWNTPNTSITAMETGLITDLKILKSLAWASISGNTIPLNELNGLRSFASIAETLLTSATTKLRLPPSIIAHGNVTETPVKPVEGPEERKPDLNALIMFQKPYPKATAPRTSILESGAGTYNIEGSRVHNEGELPDGHFTDEWDQAAESIIRKARKKGRWPANFIPGHSVDCEPLPDGRWNCAPDCAITRLDQQSGHLKSGHMSAGTVRSTEGGYHGGFPERATLTDTYGDEGGASRFFYNQEWNLERCDPFVYQGKAKSFERDAGLEEFPTITIDDGREKSIDNAYQRGKTQRKNPHPTIKPISLIEHLASLLLPPDEYAPRRLLVPFSGAGSEMIGALFAGWDFVQGLELNTPYAYLAMHRLAFWEDLTDFSYEDALPFARERVAQRMFQIRLSDPHQFDGLPMFQEKDAL